MVEGLMAFGKLETGERTLDFECCEDVAAEAFVGNFKATSSSHAPATATSSPSSTCSR